MTELEQWQEAHKILPSTIISYMCSGCSRYSLSDALYRNGDGWYCGQYCGAYIWKTPLTLRETLTDYLRENGIHQVVYEPVAWRRLSKRFKDT